MERKIKRTLESLKQVHAADIVICGVTYLLLFGTIWYVARQLEDFIELFLVAALIATTALTTWLTTKFVRGIKILEFEAEEGDTEKNSTDENVEHQ